MLLKKEGEFRHFLLFVDVITGFLDPMVLIISTISPVGGLCSPVSGLIDRFRKVACILGGPVRVSSEG